MKLNTKKKNIESGNTLSESQFGISTKDQSHILTILRDKLYSDKVLAVLREYSTNAVDAHVEAGIPEKPIKVDLPTPLSPNLVIRDYGEGLTEEEIFRTYVQYGASSKRSSNEAIGQLGLGSKSAFAYVDSFTITSYRNGKRSIYHAFIDESNMGKVVKMSESPTKEQSGIEIKVAVKRQDIHEFVERANKLFQYFDVMPQNNMGIRKKQEALVKGDGWYIPKSITFGQQSVAIMGNIGYPINPNMLESHPKWSRRMRHLLDTGVVIKVGIGDLSISASREHLEYTEDTIKNLGDKMSAVLDEFGKEIQEDLDKANSMWEAARKRKAYMESFHHHTRQLVPERWKGQQINDVAQIDTEDRPNLAELSHYSQRRFKPSRLMRSRTDAIFIDDVTSAPVKRAKNLRSQHGYSNVFIYTPEDKKNAKKTKADLDAFIAKYSLEGIPVRKLSDANYTKTSNNQGSKGLTKVKQSQWAFRYDANSSERNGWVPANTDVEQVTKAIYVPIRRYKPTIHCPKYPRDIKLLAEKLTGKNITVYGVRDNKVDKVPDSWVRVDKFFEEECKKFVKNNKSKLKYVNAAKNMKSIFVGSHFFPAYNPNSQRNWFYTNKKDRKRSQLHRAMWLATQAAKKSKKVKEMDDKSMAYDHVIRAFDLSNKANTLVKSPADQYEELKTRYPLLRHVRVNRHNYLDLLQYCEMVENYKYKK